MTLEILYVLSFVEDHVVPFLPSKGEVVLNDEFVRSNADMKGIIFAPAVSLDLSFSLRSKVCEYFEARAPLLKLHFPVHDDGGRNNNEMGSPNSSIAGQGSKHGDGLNSLTKPHFICQNSVELSVVERDHPVHSDDLVLA